MAEVTDQAPEATYMKALEAASASVHAGITQAQDGLRAAMTAKADLDRLICESRDALSSSPETIEIHLRAAVESYLATFKGSSATAFTQSEHAAQPGAQATLDVAPGAASYEWAGAAGRGEPDLEGLKLGLDDEVLGASYRPVEDNDHEFAGVEDVTPDSLAAEDDSSPDPDSAAEAEPEPGQVPRHETPEEAPDDTSDKGEADDDGPEPEASTPESAGGEGGVVEHEPSFPAQDKAHPRDDASGEGEDNGRADAETAGEGQDDGSGAEEEQVDSPHSDSLADKLSRETDGSEQPGERGPQKEQSLAASLREDNAELASDNLPKNRPKRSVLDMLHGR